MGPGINVRALESTAGTENLRYSKFMGHCRETAASAQAGQAAHHRQY